MGRVREPTKIDEIFQRMNDWSDDSGCSELQYVNSVIDDVRVNEEFDKSDGLDNESLDMLDSTLAELVEAATAARERLATLRKEYNV